MEFKDYYKILGIESDADLKVIKTAYRKLARKYHPDVSVEKDAENKFKDVAEAYAALKDPQKRAEYDELKKYGQQGQGFEPPPGWQSSSSAQGGDYSDFFESIFGSARRRGQQTHRDSGFGFRGQDIEIELPVFLEETLSDTKKTISYHLPHYGKDGQRLADVKKTLNVTVPKGTADGERIRLRGQGGPSMGGGQPGDLYLHIRLVPHPLFDIEGHNLIITVPIAPWEAVLGAKVEVPTLTGNIKLTLPANSQSGQRLRVKGKGLVGKTGIGDLYALLKIVVPEHADAETKQLWDTLSKKTAFNPRSVWRKA
ncbi:MAG: curved DNA-binding protein [Gammaproteobacteria bacterium]|nr:curved DNA-binding protein [bacterium AH-315-E07]PCH60344.1 MAG: curved DNA-binding protein [Gammaproteobacteria bacterium]